MSNVFLKSTNFGKDRMVNREDSSRKLSQVGETVVGSQAMKHYHCPQNTQDFEGS